MDTFKNEFQVFSPKLYLIAIVVGVSLGTSVLSNLFLGTNTEAEVWRKTSIQAIYEVNLAAVTAKKQVEAQQKVSQAISNLEAELKALKDPKLDGILKKYFKQGK